MLEGDGFFVSYNPDISKNPLNELMAVFDSSLPHEGNETALVIMPEGSDPQSSIYLVLSGDWRDEYEAVIADGLEACLAVYEAKKDEARSGWSEDRKLKSDSPVN